MTFPDPHPSSSSVSPAVDAIVSAPESSRLENSRQAAWRAEWDASAKSEFKRAQKAGLAMSKLAVWHLPRPGALRNASRMGCFFAGLLTLPSLGLALSPALMLKKKLPWFSRLVARWETIGPARSSFGVSVRFDKDSADFALMRVGPLSNENEQIVTQIMSGGLTKSQAKEAVIAHELGHAAYCKAMLDDGSQSIVAQSVEIAGVGKSLVDASARCGGGPGILAQHAVQGAPMLVFVAGLALSWPVSGLAGSIAASYCADKWLQKIKPKEKPLSAQILEEGFCDAFSILLPMAGPRPDVELALSRARGLRALRSGIPFGATHSVVSSSLFIADKLTEGLGENGLVFAEILYWAAAAGAMSVGISWGVSQFDELSDVMMNRDALRAQAGEHELPLATSTVARMAHLEKMSEIARQAREERLSTDELENRLTKGGPRL